MTDPPADAVEPMVLRVSDIVGYDTEFTQNKVQDYDYFYAGTQLIQLTVTTTVAEGTSASQTLYFNYDASGCPMAVTYNGNTYYYASNLQGDIIAILDTDGDAVVEYTYDAWGNILTTTGTMASTLGQINPLRYRGYVYDTETTLYYLQSRYYDPELGRFINADAFTSTGQGILGNNMYTYCLNNPIRYSDPTGCVPVFPVEISGGGGKPEESKIPDSIFTKNFGFIYGQAAFQYSGNRMGWGTYANNGCGIIAVYNALQLLGDREPLGLIEAELFNMGGFAIGGLLGVEAWAIENYFTSHGISCTRYSSYQAFSQNVQEGSVVIVLVLNDVTTLLGGAHYMAAIYMEGKYIVYNYSNYSTKHRSVDSMYQPYPGSGFVCGFIVGG